MKGQKVDIPTHAAIVLAQSWEKSLAEVFNCELEVKSHAILVTYKREANWYEAVGMKFLVLQGRMLSTSQHANSDPIRGRIVLMSDIGKAAARRWLKGIAEDSIQPSLLDDNEYVDFQPEGDLLSVLSSMRETFNAALMFYFNEKRLLDEQAVLQ